MRVVVALDSFKGSVDSRTAGEAARRGVLAADPGAQVTVHEVADGGEGTVSALLSGCDGVERSGRAYDALGRPVTASWGVVEDERGRTAVVEAARTVGLSGVGPVDETLPQRASSYGLGVQLRAVIDSGVDRVLVGLGGTATTDGGAGLLAALGADVVDEDGGPLDGRGSNPLWRGARLRRGGLPTLDVDLRVLTDVRNPLLGPTGAAATFGPQKGATPEQVELLESRMRGWAASLEGEAGREIRNLPGAGAAGGLGAALVAVGGTLEPGFDRLAAETGLRDAIADTDLVITGEGALDAQTAWGKTPAGVARMAREAGALVVGLAGRVERPVGGRLFDAVLGIHSRARSLPEALDPAVAAAEIEATSTEVVRLVTAALHRSP
jgi:glycerate kinase